MRVEVRESVTGSYFILLSYAGEIFNVGGLYDRKEAYAEKQRLDKMILAYRDTIKENNRKR